jgi:serine/threonine-protein kinase
VIGTTLEGKYRIDRLIGAGAMGAVYEGEHTGTGRHVAIKVISSGDVSRDQKLVTRFQREAKAAGAIDTQHITQVLDTGVDETGSPYLVMELLQGEDLSHAIKRLGPLSPDAALKIVAQTCLGLAKAHEAHVVHRDIKPANLFLARRDAGEIIVKLLDFGIAKVKMDQANDTESAALTKTGSMLGSPLYMSPEQAKGLKTIDHRADLWSLGIVLYQSLTGRTPYDHCDALGGLIIAICHEDVTPVQDLAPWVTPEIAAIVHKALQRDPAARFQSAQEVLDAIKPHLNGGWWVSEDQIRPVAAETRALVAPRLSIAPQSPSHSGASLPPPPGMMPQATAPASTSMPPPADLAASNSATTAALVQSQDRPPPAKPAKLPLVAALVLGAALVGGGVFALKGSGKPDGGQAVAPPVSVTAPPPPVPATGPTVAPGPTAAPKPEALAPKRVKLVILPPDAAVDIEGVKAPVKDGLLEITGAPGSVHRVHVAKGKLESTTDVIVTESGPSPPKIELTAAPKGAGTAAPKATGAATAVPSGIKATFE